MNTGPDGITTAYRPLHEHLVSSSREDLTLSIEEIESILGHPLPEGSGEDPYWWRSTARNSWTRSWLRADRRAVLDVKRREVSFVFEEYAPPMDHAQVERAHSMEEKYARAQLAYSPETLHVELRWWEPHVVYVLHVPRERLYKVGHTRHDARRIRDLTARGRATVVQQITLSNVWAAKVVEGAVLAMTGSSRRFADRFDSLNGQTEHWDDSLPIPDLTVIANHAASDQELRYWSVSHWSIGRNPDGANS